MKKIRQYINSLTNMKVKQKQLIKVCEGLYVTDYEYPFIYNTYKTNAYLIVHEEGNILLYNSSKLKSYEDHIQELGGINYCYRSHHHEGSENVRYVYDRFGCKTTVSKLEKGYYKSVEQYCDFSLQEGISHANCFKIIYTPGHTVGSFCFLYRDVNINYLFTGDSLILDKKQHLSTSSPYIDDKKELAASLLKLKNIEAPLYILGSGSFAGVQYKKIEDTNAWESQLYEIIRSLR